MIDAPTQTPVRVPAASALLALVEGTLRDLHAGGPDLPPVTLASVLDEDLGFDSLARMELLLRTERAFGIALPEDTLQRAETVADLLRAVQQGVAAPDRARAGGTGPPAFPVAAPLTEGAAAQPAAPQAAATLLEVLAWHLQAHPDQTQIVHLQDDSEQRITYRQLADAAAAVAAGLQRIGVVPRQSVAIMLPTSPEYFSTYFGILMAGAIPVPIYPPARPSQLEDHVRRHAGILDNAQAVAAGHRARGDAWWRACCRPACRACAGWSRRSSWRQEAATPAAGDAARRRHRLHPVHLGQHRQPQGRGADARQPAGQHPRDGAGRAGHAARRLRELAAALPRHGADRRLAGQPVRRHSRWW